jgi:hypothetical protein
MAQYDIKVAPEGISLRELAKPWFEELQERSKRCRKTVGASNAAGPSPDRTAGNQKPDFRGLISAPASFSYYFAGNVHGQV